MDIQAIRKQYTQVTGKRAVGKIANNVEYLMGKIGEANLKNIKKPKNSREILKKNEIVPEKIRVAEEPVTFISLIDSIEKDSVLKESKEKVPANYETKAGADGKPKKDAKGNIRYWIKTEKGYEEVK